MEATDVGDVEVLVEYVTAEISEMHAAPDGWPGNVELALIDAVLSIRAVYGVSADTGVRGAVKRYKVESRRQSWDDLGVLGEADPQWLEEVLGTRQRTGGVPKVEAIVSAAGRLAASGARHASDIDRDSAAQRDAYRGTRGLGPVTWDYFLMLVGHDGVKADTLVTRFVVEALGRRSEGKEVARLVTKAAERMSMSVSALDHSIWRHMSRPRKS